MVAILVVSGQHSQRNDETRWNRTSKALVIFQPTLIDIVAE